MVGDRKRDRKEANLGKGSKASTSKDHEDSATTLEVQNYNKKRKHVADNGGATINPKAKEDEKPKGLLQSTPESRIYAYELPKMPPVWSNIRSLVKNNEYSTPFEKQLQESDIKDQYRLNLSKKAVRKFLFPLLKDEEQQDFIGQGIPVTVYDVQGKAFPMKFESCKNDHFVLTRGWQDSVMNIAYERLKILLRCGCSAIKKRTGFALSSTLEELTIWNMASSRGQSIISRSSNIWIWHACKNQKKASF